jgi:hypothetical protein
MKIGETANVLSGPRSRLLSPKPPHETKKLLAVMGSEDPRNSVSSPLPKKTPVGPSNVVSFRLAVSSPYCGETRGFLL